MCKSRTGGLTESDTTTILQYGRITMVTRVEMFDRNLLQVARETATTPGMMELMINPIRTIGRLYPQVYREMRLVDKRLVDVLRQLVLGKAPWPLYLWGPAGCGKTAAALCLSDWMPPGEAVYRTVSAACDAVMEKRAAPMWERFGLCDLAVLDELGERRNTGDLDYSTVKRVLDLRGNYPGRIGIYISNLAPGDLQKAYDDRIASRALCGTIFKLDGEDRRRERVTR